MPARWKLVAGVCLVALPIVVAAAWLVSGRPVYTAAGKAVTVNGRDPLFGDTIPHQEFVPGPIAGHYVGLDLVAIAVLIALAGAGIWLLITWRARRRVRRQGNNDGLPAHEA
jgi:hypothetical protein